MGIGVIITKNKYKKTKTMVTTKIRVQQLALLLKTINRI